MTAGSTPPSTRTAKDTRASSTSGPTQEIDSLLGADARVFKSYYGVTPDGNFEGKNILFVGSDRATAAAARPR